MARPLNEVDASTFLGAIAAEIRRRRIKRKLSAEDVAAAAGVPLKTWYRWEAGKNLPLEALPAIAAALRCKPRDLLPKAS